jgi:hypothetical protein
MGGLASLHWKDRSFKERAKAPWFSNDSKAWAECIEDDREAMAQDLRDVAKMAAWARKHGHDQIALNISF